jgi:hypothetical protein
MPEHLQGPDTGGAEHVAQQSGSAADRNRGNDLLDSRNPSHLTAPATDTRSTIERF